MEQMFGGSDSDGPLDEGAFQEMLEMEQAARDAFEHGDDDGDAMPEVRPV